jgi:hypothetical protein
MATLQVDQDLPEITPAMPRSISASSIFMRSGVIAVSWNHTRAHARVGQGTKIHARRPLQVAAAASAA